MGLRLLLIEKQKLPCVDKKLPGMIFAVQFLCYSRSGGWFRAPGISHAQPLHRWWCNRYLTTDKC